MQNKITVRQIMDSGKTPLLEALANGAIELTDEFLDRCAGWRVSEQLKRLPDTRDRAFVLDNALRDDDAFFNGTPAEICPDEIWLNVAEIEVDMSGLNPAAEHVAGDEMVIDVAEIFEEPDDFHISGQMAYLCVGYGLTVPVNINCVRAAIDEMMEK